MTELVNKRDFARVLQLQRYRLGAAAGPLMRLTGLTTFNEWYDRLHTLHGVEFMEQLFEIMGLEIEVQGQGLQKLPKGAFITVSNHPFGMLDGLILMKLIATERPDFRVMANFLLSHIEPIRDYFIAVNPLESHPGAYSNLKGMKEAMSHVQNGMPLGIFPAGEVSTYHPRERAITDRAWQRQGIKLIQKANVPVVPIYFEGTNSALFHLMGLIHPSLRTAALPSELLRKRNAKIRVVIGSPISVKEIQSVSGVDRLARYLRSRTYSLDTGLEVHPFFRTNFRFPSIQQPIIPPVPTSLLREEIQRLGERNLICSQQTFDVYCAEAQQIPNILQELGRLRETTFRAVGEGTGHSRDLDEYDLYYLHLFIWDREEEKIVGAYRMGQGDVIMQRYGKKGFYTYSVFKMADELVPILTQSVELGRSFITEEYQRKRLPLFLLWKGIHHYMTEHSDRYRYLIGPVSISNDYSSLSKQVIVALIERFFFDHELARWVQPRKRFRPRIRKVDVEGLVEGVSGDLNQMDRLIEEIEPAHFRLPILLKKYIKQNAKIIAFNVDPKFNNCLDGFMILDMKDVPAATMENMSD
ncbi:MAG: lysophospholipid acyltransferase family protein [Bacteroidetes bacterium]|nr:MAG: lysophospholipid acyltransferase family protein [Bacteroidota bacterium]